MRKGFTLIELMVASLLLGMLVMILTMVFNQSSIAWRTGTALIADLDDARENIALIRHEADNAVVVNDRTYLLLSPWDQNGALRTRPCSADYSAEGVRKMPTLSGSTLPTQLGSVSVGGGSSQGVRNYVVNVLSAGPDREFDTYDDIWSFPDDFEM